MERLLLYDRQKSERKALVQKLHDCTAFLSDEQLQVEECARAAIVSSVLEANRALDLAVMEIKERNDIELTKSLRKLKAQIELMLVADSTISPMEYLTPDVWASALLLRPCTKEQLEKVVKSFMAAYFSSRERESNEPSILIENRQGKSVIPCRSIYYVEVRGKKLYIRQQDREYTKYETLDNIMKLLPDYFLQSHRSFVFNTRFLDRVKLSENMVYLEHGIIVPLSRTYKTQVREFMNERQQSI